MSSKVVVLSAQIEQGPGFVRVGGAHGPVVLTDLFGERPGLPAFHPRRGDSKPVDPSSPDRNITSNVIKALLPEQLTCARHMLDVAISVVVGIAAFNEGCPRHTESGVFSEFLQQERNVVGIECDVGIQISYDVIIVKPGLLETGIERVHLRPEMPVPTLGHAYKPHPRMILEIALNNIVRAIR